MSRPGWEQINIRFTVGTYDFSSIDGDSGWHLVLRNTDRPDGGGFIVQRWDHKPGKEEIDNIIFAVKQGIGFITTHLAVERPPRHVEVIMPRIRIEVIDE
jgi:hypothetical protein